MPSAKGPQQHGMMINAPCGGGQTLRNTALVSFASLEGKAIDTLGYRVSE